MEHAIRNKIQELNEELKNEKRYFMIDGLRTYIRTLEDYLAGKFGNEDLQNMYSRSMSNKYSAFSWPAKAMAAAKASAIEFIAEQAGVEVSYEVKTWQVM